MKTFICYDNTSLYILGFIRNDYSKKEDITFSFENSTIKETELEPPANYEKYRVLLSDGEIVGFEEGIINE